MMVDLDQSMGSHRPRIPAEQLSKHRRGSNYFQQTLRKSLENLRVSLMEVSRFHVEPSWILSWVVFMEPA